MAIEVFNRYENKYMIDTKTFFKIRDRISNYCELDDYNIGNKTYKITNIYYDTDDNHLISTSLKKPTYKEKLRIRSYESVTSDSKVYIEIKKKVKGLVNKRRSGINLGEAYKFLETGEMPVITNGMNKQVLKEVKYILEQHKLIPKLYLSYDRLAYFAEGQHDLRISFDTNILSRRTDLKLEFGSFGEQLLDHEKWLMEVKSEISIPVWLAKMLSEYKVYPTSFSKYGKEYKRHIMRESKSFVYTLDRENEKVEQEGLALVY